MTRSVKLLVNGESFQVDVLSESADMVQFCLGDRTYQVSYEKTVPKQQEAKLAPLGTPVTRGDGSVCAPMPGVIVEVLAAVGQNVSAGETLVRLEAMKMQNNVLADCDGVIEAIHVSEGVEVDEGQVLVVVKKG